MVRPTPREQHLTGSTAASEALAAGNHRIKRLRRLVSQRKARSDERAFVVEGPALVAEAIDLSGRSKVTVEGVYLEPDQESEAVARARSRGIPVYAVTRGVLASALGTVTPQPVAAVVSRAPADLGDLAIDEVVVVLVDPRDPGNVGTLIRSAEAAGAAGLVLCGSAVDPTNPKVLRAAAGAGLRLPVVTMPDTLSVLDELAESGRTLVATVIDGDAIPYDRFEWAGAAMILGNETHGLAADVLERADIAVTIPLAGPTESLNLGVAGSILCFEALRQRRSGE